MSKEIVYALLRQRREGYLSGEELSAQLGISRAAVWKAVDALRRDGYTIEARTGLGYRLCAAPGRLTAREIRGYLGAGGRLGRELLCLETVDSTNSCLKRAAMEGAAEGLVAVAEEQTGGRGRRGRSFASPAGKGVFLSLLLRPAAMKPEQVSCLTALTAVAVCRAVEAVCGAQVQIKWTNDLILAEKKLGGILTEMTVESETGLVESVIPGIGLNVSHSGADFPPEVAPHATSLEQVLQRTVSRPALAAAVIAAMDSMYLALLAGQTGDYLEEYRRRCITLGREVRLLGEPLRQAFAQDIDQDFGLVVRLADGSCETIRFGEVSVRGLQGYL